MEEGNGARLAHRCACGEALQFDYRTSPEVLSSIDAISVKLLTEIVINDV
ncbi:hypothetical protein FHR84_002341 [Actinopolyspora biskrensis]|uniref:Uncharacterized protein n=1 Tax=Actinopolyspora biskrensis TaxID=1470178 RepID=A0A852Z918_9ACTN|nr:hypothetical protein [Actinopolyspora biskrensis]